MSPGTYLDTDPEMPGTLVPFDESNTVDQVPRMAQPTPHISQQESPEEPPWWPWGLILALGFILLIILALVGHVICQAVHRHKDEGYDFTVLI